MRAFKVPYGAKAVTNDDVKPNVEPVVSASLLPVNSASLLPVSSASLLPVSSSLLPMKRSPVPPASDAPSKPIYEKPEFSSLEKAPTKLARKAPLFQERAMSTLRLILSKPSQIVLLVAPSGHGKSHCLEAIEPHWVCDLDVDEDESEGAAFEKLLDMSLRRNPLKKQRIAIHCIENLDTNHKRALSSFLKKNKDHPAIQLVLTSDGLFESPTTTLRKDPKVSTVTLNEYDPTKLSSIVIDQARDQFQMNLSEKSVANLCENARGNPRAALQAFDFAARTRRATKGKFESDRDCPMDIFKQVPSLVRGRPMRMDLESSDLFFATMLTFENSTIHRDHLEMIDIVSKRQLLDSASTQAYLEIPFKVQSQYLEGRMRMLGPSKKKPIRDAAQVLDPDCPIAKPSDLDAHDRLKVMNAQLAKEKTLTKKNVLQHEDADIRELRKKGPFV